MNTQRTCAAIALGLSIDPRMAISGRLAPVPPMGRAIAAPRLIPFGRKTESSGVHTALPLYFNFSCIVISAIPADIRMGITMDGYAGNMVSVDLSAGTVTISPTPPELKKEYLGGRGFGIRLLTDLVDPQTEPLSEKNIVVFAAGYAPEPGQHHQERQERHVSGRPGDHARGRRRDRALPTGGRRVEGQNRERP